MDKKTFQEDEFFCRRMTKHHLLNNGKICYTLFLDQNNDMSVDRSAGRSVKDILIHQEFIYITTRKSSIFDPYYGFAKIDYSIIKEDPNFNAYPSPSPINTYHSTIELIFENKKQKRDLALKLANNSFVEKK